MPRWLFATIACAALGGLGCTHEEQREEWVTTSISSEARLSMDSASLRRSPAAGLVWFHERVKVTEPEADLDTADWVVTIKCLQKEVAHSAWVGHYRDGHTERIVNYVLNDREAEEYLRYCRFSSG